MKTIRVDNDVWCFLQSRARPFEDSPNDVLRREFKLGVHTSQTGTADRVLGDMPEANGEGQGEADEDSVISRPVFQRHRSDDLRPDKDYTHFSVRGYKFEGRHTSSRSFKDVLIRLCNDLRRTHLEKFDNVAVALQGKKRVYFSRNPRDLKFPEELLGNGLFAETNLNANLMVGICRKLLEKLSYDPNSFQID
jgi:negative regulator of replication initiation